MNPSSPTRNIERLIAEIDGARPASPTAKFVEYSPWMSTADVGFMWSLIRCAARGEPCSSAELDHLKSTVRRAIERKQAGDPPYSAS